MAKEESALKFIESKPTKKHTFYLKMLMLISILICSEYFHMTKIICARNVKTVSVSGLGFWYWIQSPESWYWIWSRRSYIVGPGSWIPSSGYWVPVHSMAITKYGKKNQRKVWQVLQSLIAIAKFNVKVLVSVTGIPKYDRYCKVWQKSIVKCDRYYKVWQDVITKWDVTYY